MHVTDAIMMQAEIDDNHPEYTAVVTQVSKFQKLETLMLTTHDFNDSSTWAQQDPLSSEYTIDPLPGYKLIITSIMARFPETVGLGTNNLSFTIYKYVEPYGLIPAVQDIYTSIAQLLTISNSPWYTVGFQNQNIFQEKMIEAKFRYAPSDESE